MYRKFEKYFRNYSPFHIRLKNFGELWSTKKKVIVAHIDEVDILLETTFRPLRGSAP